MAQSDLLSIIVPAGKTPPKASGMIGPRPKPPKKPPTRPTAGIVGPRPPKKK